MTRDIVVYGTGGVGRQTVQIIEDLNGTSQKWNLLGYLDDDSSKTGDSLHDIPVLGSAEWLHGRGAVWIVIAIGSSVARMKVARKLRELGHTSFATLIHPSVHIGHRCRIGTGTILYPGAVVDTDVALGEFVLINKTCTLGHDAVISDYVTMSPGVNLGGATQIGDGCEFGINSSAIQGISVGSWSIVGAGAVILDELPPNVTAVGIPARIVKQRQPKWYEE